LKSAIFGTSEGPVTLTLNRVIWHTVTSFIDLYVHTKFHWNQTNFWWTDVWTLWTYLL